MAEVSLLDRAASYDRVLADQRKNVENLQQFEVTDLPQFSENLQNGQFLNYFYPWEKIYIKTNNFEKFYPRSIKTNKFFHNEMQLNDYTMHMSNTSSNNEDRPPPSEELFFDSDDQNAYDKIMQYTRYAPRMTQLQSSLLRDLAPYVIRQDDDQHAIHKKQHKRLELIRGYCKELKRKRFAKAFQRFTKVRAKKQSVGMEAMELLEREMIDKNLLRYDYYDPNEPSEYKNILLEARKRALKAKYLQYLSDPKYRRMYRDRIYYNVNQDVQLDDRQNINGSVMLINGDEMNDPTVDPEITEAVRLLSVSPRRRQHRKPNIQNAAGVSNEDEYVAETVPMSKDSNKYLSDLNQELVTSGKQSLFSSQTTSPIEIPTSEAEFISDLESVNKNQSTQNADDKKRHLLEAMVRFRQVKAVVTSNSPADESKLLAELEIRGKNLEKTPTNPMSLYWRNKRVKAIRRKCNRYAQDPDFRRRFARRMESSPNENILDRTFENRSFGGPVANQTFNTTFTGAGGSASPMNSTFTSAAGRAAPLNSTFTSDAGRAVPMNSTFTSELPDNQRNADERYQSLQSQFNDSNFTDSYVSYDDVKDRENLSFEVKSPYFWHDQDTPLVDQWESHASRNSVDESMWNKPNASYVSSPLLKYPYTKEDLRNRRTRPMKNKSMEQIQRPVNTQFNGPMKINNMECFGTFTGYVVGNESQEF